MLQKGSLGAFSHFSGVFGAGLSEFARGIGVQQKRRISGRIRGDWDTSDLKKNNKNSKKIIRLIKAKHRG